MNILERDSLPVPAERYFPKYLLWGAKHIRLLWHELFRFKREWTLLQKACVRQTGHRDGGRRWHVCQKRGQPDGLWFIMSGLGWKEPRLAGRLCLEASTLLSPWEAGPRLAPELAGEAGVAAAGRKPVVPQVQQLALLFRQASFAVIWNVSYHTHLI